MVQLPATMVGTMNRRIFLKNLTVSTCLAAGSWPALAADTTVLNATAINDNLAVVTGAGGNVVVFKGKQGLTLIDSGSKAAASNLLTLLDQHSGNAPLVNLFNTHWHEDHSGGNAAVHERGAKIIAHENTKLWLGADFDVPWRDTTHKPRSAAAIPDETFYTSGSMDLGGETVEYIHTPQAHTDGDIFLYFPVSNVMVAGGLLSNGKYPICDIATGGWIGGLLAANAEMLARADDNTVIIPDRGQPLRKADLQKQHDMLADIYEQMKTQERLGANGHDMLRDKLTAAYDAQFGDPEEFVLETYRGMWAHTYDMGGFI